MALYRAFLNPRSPRFDDWRGILGQPEVPLESPRCIDALFGDEGQVRIYKLAVNQLSVEQRRRLIAWVAEKFSADPTEIDQELDLIGFPIREADVILCFDMRAFI